VQNRVNWTCTDTVYACTVYAIYMLLSLIKNYGKKSLKHKATVLWNGLPNTLKKVSSIK